MYSQRFGIVQREVKGPTPKVVMVVSRGCVRAPTAFCILEHSRPSGAQSGLQRGAQENWCCYNGVDFEKDNFA